MTKKVAKKITPIRTRGFNTGESTAIGPSGDNRFKRAVELAVNGTGTCTRLGSFEFKDSKQAASALKNGEIEKFKSIEVALELGLITAVDINSFTPDSAFELICAHATGDLDSVYKMAPKRTLRRGPMSEKERVSRCGVGNIKLLQLESQKPIKKSQQDLSGDMLVKLKLKLNGKRLIKP